MAKNLLLQPVHRNFSNPKDLPTNLAVVRHAELPKKLSPAEDAVVIVNFMMQFAHHAVNLPKFRFNPVVINPFIAAIASNPEDLTKTLKKATPQGGFFIFCCVF